MAFETPSNTWSPLDLQRPDSFTFGTYAVMVLNCPIEVDKETLCTLWDKAELRSTVDGGTDRWLNFLDDNSLTVTKRFPDVVSGDFDSINPDTLRLCREHKCYVEETPDQNYTDFVKGIRVVINRLSRSIDSIVVVAECSGRVDQSFSILNTLDMGCKLEGTPRIYLLSNGSLTWHLCRGNHSINIPRHLIERQQWCAILPFEPKENCITTTGLKWNLDRGTVKFGGLISSSNTYEGPDVVTLKTDAELLWSMGL